MVTNYPRRLTAANGVSTGEHARRNGQPATLVARVMTRLGQLFCGMTGHDAVLHVEGNRVMMRCTSCGHDTPGWEISGRGPKRRYEGDARRHLLPKRHHLVLRKSA
jgi:hypothetical protein